MLKTYWVSFTIDKCYIPFPYSVRVPESLWELYLRKGNKVIPELKALIMSTIYGDVINVEDIKIKKLYVKR